MQQRHELHLDAKHYHGDFVAYVVNVRKSKWWGQPIYQLGAYGRRKFENWVVLQTPDYVKVIYGNN